MNNSINDHQTPLLALLRFDGARFSGHALDIDCTRELLGYRSLVLECAKELWKRGHPDRPRLPKNFEIGFRLEFDRVLPGSTGLPLRRTCDQSQSALDLGDEFDEAAALIDQVIVAADQDQLLPAAFPSNVVPLFSKFGNSLRGGETLYLKARLSKDEAPYSERARKRLADWVPPSYEDRVDLMGEVRMASVGPGAFKLQMPDGGPLVDGRFESAHESMVLLALKDHQQTRLRVVGLGEFGTHDRQFRRLLRVDHIEMLRSVGVAFDADARPIWDVLGEAGATAPPGTWDDVPVDLSERVDEVVYGPGSRDA